MRLTLECNNACIFCAQRGLVPTPALERDAIGAALDEARSSCDEVSFIGGEPALSARLEDAVAMATARDFSRIGLQSNGRSLSRPVLTALAQAGLSDLALSIHGARAEVHDYHTGRAGSFDAALAALKAARAAGLSIVVTTVLTRSSYRVVGELVGVLSTRGVAGWALSVLHEAGGAAAHADRLAPRLELALPFALHALESARRVGLPTFIAGAPLCLLGPHARYALTDGKRAYPPQCAGCAGRAHCDGLDSAYLARFGARRLTPLSSPPPSVDEGAWIARAFAGTGELAPAPDSVKRRSLRILADNKT